MRNHKVFLFFLFISFLIVPLVLTAQSKNDIIAQIKKFQQELNESYLNPAGSPLDSLQRSQFVAHQFFPINLKYRIVASFEKANNDTVRMDVSSKKIKKDFIVYGYANFFWKGKTYKLCLYQSVKYMHIPLYANDLFLPFTDLTNGKETYSGGRYIDLKIPEGDKIVIDFNQCYHPYCVYSDKYACPIPPPENFLPIKIKAGIQLPKNYNQH